MFFGIWTFQNSSITRSAYGEKYTVSPQNVFNGKNSKFVIWTKCYIVEVPHDTCSDCFTLFVSGHMCDPSMPQVFLNIFVNEYKFAEMAKKKKKKKLTWKDPALCP